MVMGDRSVKERYIASAVGISQERIHSYGRSGYEENLSPLCIQTSDS